MIDGPRSLRTGEMAALRELEAKVFRPSMPDEYPQVFNEDTYEGLTVCFDGSRCVSHVGMVERSASLFGCRVAVGLIGGVATDPEYRGQGLAGACVDHAFAKARRDGIDFLMISGDRSLYLRRDCVAVGRDSLFTLSSTNADSLIKSLPSVRIEPITEAELPLIRDLYRQEPVRFLRHQEDYQDLFRCDIVLDQLSDFLAIRVPGSESLQAYLIVPRRADKRGNFVISEIAGDRRAVLSAACQLFSRSQDLSQLQIYASRHDTQLHSLLTQAGLQPETVTTSGTVRLVNFPQLMDRLHPLLNETLGRRIASALSFQEEGDTCIFRFGNEALRVGRADAARLLFGTPDRSEESLYDSLGNEFATILRTLLPFPALWYGLSFV
jgi:predicted N-acetyltransferase YhbS